MGSVIAIVVLWSHFSFTSIQSTFSPSGDAGRILEENFLDGFPVVRGVEFLMSYTSFRSPCISS